MRQVPEQHATPFGIVGSGRVARHFHHYFTLLGLPVCVWSRRGRAPSPPDALASCRTVLLLIRDEAIVPFVDAWPALQEKRLVHCSGSLVTPAAEGAHPLMTFGPTLYELAEYRAIPFVLDAGGTPFAELLPGLPNPSLHDPSGGAPVLPRLVRDGWQLLNNSLGEALRRTAPSLRDAGVGRAPVPCPRGGQRDGRRRPGPDRPTVPRGREDGHRELEGPRRGPVPCGLFRLRESL